MIKQLTIAAAAAAFALAPAAPAPAVAADLQFSGRVVHVSTDNIKVRAPRSGEVKSFMLVPHFDQVFHFNGKTTYQMKRLTPGTPVTVYYDRRALGIRHADRIVVMDNGRTVRG